MAQATQTRLYESYELARKAADALKDAGVPQKGIRLISNETGKAPTDTDQGRITVSVETDGAADGVVEEILNGGTAGANEGEGSRTAARAYNKGAEGFAKSGKVNESAREAAQAVDGPQGPDLKDAEAIGKSHSHGEDPQVSRRR